MQGIETLAPAPGLMLVVDDNEVMRDLLSRNLRGNGHIVVTAPDGHKALELLQEQPFDLVLLDMMMPGLSGIEVLRRLKGDPATAQIPVLIISADSDVEQIASCIELGADDYLVKPFNGIILKARVTSCLEKRRLRLKERSYQHQLEAQVAERTALAEQRAAALEQSEAQLRHQTAVLESVLNSMGDGVVVVDRAGALVHHNPAARRILGERLPELLPGEPLAPRTLRRAGAEEAPSPAALPLASALDGSEVVEMELVAPSAGEGEQWLSISARPLRNQGGAGAGAVAIVRDISAAKRADLALRASEERYALAARGANDGLWDWDLAGDKIYLSPRWKAMLGYEDHEISASPREWLERVHPDDREPLETRLAAHQRQLISHLELEYRIWHRDGGYRWMLCRGLAICDEHGRAMRMAGSQTDITDRKLAEQQLERGAFYDSLTGLPNRALFLNRLDHNLNRLNRGLSSSFGVLFLDLDRFKVINDSLGHAVGDQLLVTTARRLESCLRPGDTVARLGGDEFTILLEDLPDAEAAHRVAERIQEVLSVPVSLGGQDTFTSASIGIVLSGPAYRAAQDMIRDADTAMYHAKMHGKARAVLFDAAMHAEAMALLQLESDLRWAIERDELRVHYQPIVSLESGHMVGVEALVRWQHPERGLLFPGEFLTLAEETGLIGPISWWVLGKACAQLAEWQHLTPESMSLWMSVNLSAKQLTQLDIVDQVRRVLDETGLDPQRLKLEITEHTLVISGEQTIRALTQLRELGVQLCIDDFGTGYSSLSYLQRFPVDVLKIDRSFIKQLGEHDEGSEIVRTIISLARTLGLRAVAEGTETSAQVDELRRLACDFGQGWLFSRAVAAEDLLNLLEPHDPLGGVGAGAPAAGRARGERLARHGRARAKPPHKVW